MNINTGLLCVLCCWLQVATGQLIVDTTYGPVQGTEVPIHTGQIIDSFLAIPFAKAPVDELRFLPPQEPDPWTDVFIANETGNACIQNPAASSVQISHFGYTRFDEDCLHLNVYVPQRESAEPLPVMVWIHGGGFTGGANFIYFGYFLAAKDVVVVTVNYRLGIFGYATTGDDVIPGNMGMLDQAQALRWIQENIAAFGGDPGRVTIAGESAGAASVGLLMVSPLTTGLFHGAILESGSELAPWVIYTPGHNPGNYLQQVAEQVGCPTETSQEMADCLRTVGTRELRTAEFNCTDGYVCGGFTVVIDGEYTREGAFLPDHPLTLREQGQFSQVPEMIGTTEDDGSLFVWAVDPSIGQGLNRSDYDAYITAAVEAFAPRFPDRVDDVIQAIRFYYAEYPYFDDPLSNRDQLYMMTTDLTFGMSSDYQAKMHTETSPVYYYIYDYTIDNFIFPDHLGCFHALELVMLFGWPYIWMEENQAAFNHSGVSTLNAVYTQNDTYVSDYIMTMWTNFVKFANPTPEAVGPEDGAAITWPQYTRDNLTYALLSREPEVKVNYRQKNYAFWSEYLNWMVHGTDFAATQRDDTPNLTAEKLSLLPLSDWSMEQTISALLLLQDDLDDLSDDQLLI